MKGSGRGLLLQGNISAFGWRDWNHVKPQSEYQVTRLRFEASSSQMRVYSKLLHTACYCSAEEEQAIARQCEPRYTRPGRCADHPSALIVNKTLASKNCGFHWPWILYSWYGDECIFYSLHLDTNLPSFVYSLLISICLRKEWRKETIECALSPGVADATSEVAYKPETGGHRNL